MHQEFFADDHNDFSIQDSSEDRRPERVSKIWLADGSSLSDYEEIVLPNDNTKKRIDV